MEIEPGKFSNEREVLLDEPPGHKDLFMNLIKRGRKTQ